MADDSGEETKRVLDFATESIKKNWPLNQDGIPFRRAARVVLLDDKDRLLLIKGHDFSDPSRTWWFTPGGGLEENETSKQAAVRELAEETGIHVNEADLEGPVLRRDTMFRFAALTCRQDEEFFLVRINDKHPDRLDRAGFTELEKFLLDDLAWWSVEELEQAQEAGVTIYPHQLVSLAKGWVVGWDETCVQILEAQEETQETGQERE